MTAEQTTSDTTRPDFAQRFNFARQSGLVACAAVAVVCCVFPFMAPDSSQSVRLPIDSAISSNPDDAGATTPVAFMLDLNQASAKELGSLPKIGEKTAARIVDYREKNGGFSTVDDLLNVRGIGSKTLEKLRPFCYVTPSSDQDDPSR